MSVFGTKLRQLREAAGLTQKELAVKSGLTQQAIDTWERGTRDPGWSKVVKLCAALEVECGTFLEVEPCEPAPEPPLESPVRKQKKK